MADKVRWDEVILSYLNVMKQAWENKARPEWATMKSSESPEYEKWEKEYESILTVIQLIEG